MAIAPPTMRYPLAYVTYGREEIDAVVETLELGQTTCGAQVANFEDRFARYVGREHAVMVNSGSSADLLVAFGLGRASEGYEVLVPAVTWPTQVWACLMAGYTVRLVDVDPATLQMDLDDLERKISPKTKAVFTVHVLGACGDLDRLTKLATGWHLTLLEDCCEALGTMWRGKHVGTFGQAAAYSFFFSHVLNTMEGGMVVCDDDAAAREYRLWRSHGWEPQKDHRFWFPTWGLNLRPTELQGAFGNVQMGKLKNHIENRLLNEWRLSLWVPNEHVRDIQKLYQCSPSWHAYPLMVEPGAPFSRDELCRYLDTRGIENRPIIAGNLARQPALRDEVRIHHDRKLPGADAIHERGFYIGLASFDDPNGTGYVAEVIRDFLKAY
jgi:CDP-6-deoxy-D-xylo-4-hexulose-3-dehydrase